jgi:hypothetical protein
MMIRQRPFVAAIAVAGLVAIALVVVTVATLSGGSRHGLQPKAAPSVATAGPFPAEQTGFTSVPPLTDSPAQTPVQEQYDSAFASGLSSSSTLATAERTKTPSPAYSPSWPAIPTANTPESWSTEFVQRLLDIDFAHQTRAGLGGWLSAEEAPELLPGVPADVAGKVLYLSIFEADTLGSGPSPIPDQAGWDSLARAGERWTVTDLLAQPDPTFSQIVAAGWQPIDQRFAVEDVSGLLTVATGSTPVQHHFTMTVYVGSAHWHPGYGSVLVDQWKET